MKIAIILGTRPEIIKMSPIIRCCEKENIEYFIIHTGQHYSYEMDKVFFEELELKQPKYNLESGVTEYKKQLGIMIRGIQNVLMKEKPDVAFVQGDTSSVLAGALAANKLGIKVGHHEAGLRCHDLRMLEEANRIITDHISDFLFAPTKDALKNLEDEGIDKVIKYSGNTIVDAIFENVKVTEKKVDIINKLKLEKKKYFLITIHRAENVDKKERLEGIMKGIEKVIQKYKNYKMIFVIHPRTKKTIKKFSLRIPEKVQVINPMGFLEFLQLEKWARIILTDSGGIQEEACVLKIPCVTLRDNTERPETLIDGINVLAGVNPDKILEAVDNNINKKNVRWMNPFGDGKATERIISTIMEQH